MKTRLDQNEFNLTAAEAEILFACCTLATEQDALIAKLLKLEIEKNTAEDGVAIYQDDLAEKLFRDFKDGRGVASDKRKAKKYNTHLNPDKTTEPDFISTETIYTALSWYTSTRIFLVRLAHVFFKGWLNRNIVHTVFKFLGLSYLIEFCFDLAVCIKNTVRPSGEMEKKLPWTTRFVNSLKKDNRGWRMLNALGWTLFNGALALFTGGMSLAVQACVSITGFTFDVLLECGKWIDVKRHQNLLDKLDTRTKNIAKKINDIDQAISHIEKNIHGIKDRERACEEITKFKTKKTELQKEHETLIKLRPQLEKKLGEVKKNRQFLIGIAVAILVCMTLVTLPFGGHIVVFAATLATLAIGSIYTGFGRRIFDFFKNKLFPKEKKLERNKKLTSCSTNLSIKRSLDKKYLASSEVVNGIENVEILAPCKIIDKNYFAPPKTMNENHFTLFKNEKITIEENYFAPENVGIPYKISPSSAG